MANEPNSWYSSEPATSRERIWLWVLSLVLGAMFLFNGIAKLFSQPMWVDNFETWGYPDRFYLLVGLAETIAGVLVLIPRTRFMGAEVIGVVMVAAIATHLANGGIAFVGLPLLNLALASLLWWYARPPVLRQNERFPDTSGFDVQLKRYTPPFVSGRSGYPRVAEPPESGPRTESSVVASARGTDRFAATEPARTLPDPYGLGEDKGSSPKMLFTRFRVLGDADFDLFAGFSKKDGVNYFPSLDAAQRAINQAFKDHEDDIRAEMRWLIQQRDDDGVHLCAHFREDGLQLVWASDNPPGPSPRT